MLFTVVIFVALQGFLVLASTNLPRSSQILHLRGGSAPFYENNGGTVVAIAGPNFVVLGADKRLSKGYSILSRDHSRLHEVSQGVWLGVAGCHADAIALVQGLQATLAEYQLRHGHAPSVEAVSQALSVTLYQRRSMPYYCFCVLVGLDAMGRGAVFNYDAVGSFERVSATAVGGSQSIILPLLDEIAGCNQRDSFENYEPGLLVWNRGARFPSAGPCVAGMSLEESVCRLQEVVEAAAERDIRLGDRLELVLLEDHEHETVTRNGRMLSVGLKRH